MNILIKLTLREAVAHRSRITLAAVATAAMSAMLVWLIGSINLAVMQYENDGEHYLGHYSCAVIPPNDRETVFSAARLVDDPLVLEVAPAVQIRNTMAKWEDEQSILRRQRAGHGIPMGSPMVIGIDTKECPFELEDGKWFAQKFEGIIGTAAAKSLQVFGERPNPVKVGDDVGVRIGEKEYKIRITGTVEQKLGGGFGQPGRNITPAVGALYVSMETAKQLSADIQPQYYYVRLKDGVNADKWIAEQNKGQDKEQNKERSSISPTFITAADIQNMLNEQRGRGTDGLVSGVASKNSIMLFASFVSILIVFSALSMGINERSRTFARLRTIGMPRRSVAFLVFGEGLILSVFGWVGGILAGWTVLQLSAICFHGSTKLVLLSVSAVLVSGLAALIGAVLASIIPAWRGASIQPLEGMSRGKFTLTRRLRFGIAAAGIAGVLLSVVNPVICYYEPLTQTGSTRQLYYTCIGLPAQLLGLLLLIPAVILLVEAFFTPLIAKVLCVPKALLKNQLSSNLWRTMGTAIALSVGLGIYAFLEISGYSMLVPFTHTDKLPDTLAAMIPKGLPLTDIDKVKAMPGVHKERFLPIALEQPLFSKKQTEQFQQNEMSPMQAGAGIVVFGLDIVQAFDGTHPMVSLPFTEGTLNDALTKLKTGGRYCIVPDSFAFRAKLHIGDKLELLVPGNRDGMPRGGTRGMGGGRLPWAGKPIEYEVAGVVSVPGWLWMAKLSGIRKYGYRSGAMMFAPYETVQNDFKINDAAYFWFDRIGDTGDEELENSLQKLADATIGTETFRPMVKVSSHDYLNSRVGSRADQVIQAAARMPLVLLAISSFAMMGTIAASIRVRRFEFGVLRSLGMTRWGLVRLILAEALLISIAAVVLSVAFGVLGGWCFVGLMRYVSFFGGFVNPLTIPVCYLSIGIGTAVVMCLLAAVFPAITAGRKEPSTLLRI